MLAIFICMSKATLLLLITVLAAWKVCLVVCFVLSLLFLLLNLHPPRQFTTTNPCKCRLFHIDCAVQIIANMLPSISDTLYTLPNSYMLLLTSA